MWSPLTKTRRFLIRLLEDTEDDLGEDSGIVPVPEPDPAKPASLKEIRDNHLYHQALAINALHIRIGRVEAKLGLQLALQFLIASAIVGAAAKIIIEGWLNSFIPGA